MELYVLDSLLRRVKVVDGFDSLIWAERFQTEGDIEITLQSTREYRDLFQQGTWLALNQSYRCMQVESVEDKTDSEGKRTLSVKGPSIEIILDDRVAFNVKDDLTTHPKWTITDAPADVARKVFHDVCVTGVLDTDDILPFIVDVDVLPPDTIPEPAADITVEIEPASVLEVIKNICSLYDLGYRLIRNFDTSQLVFDIYAGSDRTTQQSTLMPVIFSVSLENLKNTSELTTTAGIKNIAYVYSPVGFEEVVADGVDPSVIGFERKVLVVKADDITNPTPATATALMIQRGKEELSKHQAYGAFDGEINQNIQYIYGVDYQLGDLVEQQNSDGAVNVMRVTEQIFVQDAEGERAYPTLTVQQFVTPGSWAGWPAVQWFDYDDDPTFYWADAP